MARKKSNGRRDNRTGSIFKDGEGYRVQILLRYGKDGKPVYKKQRAKTHDDAVDALKKLQSEAGARFIPSPTGLTLGGYLEQWLEIHVKPSKAPKTYDRYCWAVNRHVVPALGKMHIEHVARTDVQALVAGLTKKKVAERAKPKEEVPEYEGKPGPKRKKKPEKAKKPATTLSRLTIQAVTAVLHAAYEDAKKDGLASLNPADDIKLPPARRMVGSQFLTPEQVVKLNEKLEGSPIKELVRFMLATGTRLGEATGMRWEDLDIEKRFARIAGQLQRVNGKLEYRATTKTNQDRILTMSPWLADELKAMKTKQMVDNHTDPDGIAFLNPDGLRFDPKYVLTKLKASCEKAGIPPISPHKLRHTAATLALMETGDLHGVQKMLGHQQVALTSNLYGHATAERLRPITDALGKLVRPASDSQAGKA